MNLFVKTKSVIKKYIILIKILVILLPAAIVTFSSLVYLLNYDTRTKIIKFYKRQISFKEPIAISQESDSYWANEILKGGYILHFRHTEREKWQDIYMYDALESDVHQNGKNNSRYAENDYFEKAVCLNSRGKIQAKAIGENLKNFGVPIGHVASSVSCRTRQTADLAFGGYDSQHRILVHGGPYTENEEKRIKLLTEFYKNLPKDKSKNTIVSAHNQVINCKMFVNEKNCPTKLTLEEGGFYIISNTNQELRFEYEFDTFSHFMKNFYLR